MIVNLAKIFPEACSDNGIDELVINTAKITKLSIDETISPAEYFVQIGRTEYKFSIKDFGPDQALEALATIYLSELNLKTYLDLSQYIPEFVKKKSVQNLLEMCKENLTYYESILGTKKPSLKSSN